MRGNQLHSVIRDAPPSRPAAAVAAEAEQLVCDLQRRVADAEDALRSFKDKRAPHASAAAGGHLQAKAELEVLSADEAVARRALDDLRAELAKAEVRRALANVAVTEEADVAALANAREIGHQYVEQGKRIDGLLAELREAVACHANIERRLVASGCLPPSTICSAEGLGSAFRFAQCDGLYRSNPLRTAPRVEPLAAFDAQTVSHLQLPSRIRAAPVA